MKEQDPTTILMDISNRIHAKFKSLLPDLELTDEFARMLVASAAYSGYVLNLPAPGPDVGCADDLARITLMLSAASLLKARHKCQQRVLQVYGQEKVYVFLDSVHIPPPAEVTLEMLQDLTKDWNYTPAPMNNGQTIH